MKGKLIAVAVSGVLCASLAPAQERKTPGNDTPPGRVTIFQVPLRCPAAPAIGCGSAAKPILLQLERDSSVSGAWLNRAGTMIAVVWKAEPKRKDRRTVAGALKEEKATEVKGAAREKAVAELLSGNGWYRGADVDRLSEEEAGIIAARLVSRVRAKTTLSEDKAESLRRALAEALIKRFTDEKAREEQDLLLQTGEAFQRVAGAYLEKEQIPILREAVESGLRPLPDEK